MSVGTNTPTIGANVDDTTTTGFDESDTNADGISDIEQTLRNINIGIGGYFAISTVDASRTFYESALDLISDVVGNLSGQTGAVIFSDGSGQLPTLHDALQSYTVTTHTAALGPYALAGQIDQFREISDGTDGVRITYHFPGLVSADGGYSAEEVGINTGVYEVNAAYGFSLTGNEYWPLIVAGSSANTVAASNSDTTDTTAVVETLGSDSTEEEEEDTTADAGGGMLPVNDSEEDISLGGKGGSETSTTESERDEHVGSAAEPMSADAVDVALETDLDELIV